VSCGKELLSVVLLLFFTEELVPDLYVDKEWRNASQFLDRRLREMWDRCNRR